MKAIGEWVRTTGGLRNKMFIAHRKRGAMDARDQIEDLMDWVYAKNRTMNEAWFKGVHIGVLMKSKSQNNFDALQTNGGISRMIPTCQ